MSKPDSLQQHSIRGNGIDLSVLELGHADNPTVVMVHGLRDSAWALLSVARHLCKQNADGPGYRVLIPELRGHGASGRSDAYAMPDFLLDLHEVVRQMTPEGCSLFGHSLGGHLVIRFASLFPETVKAISVVEGLGPPGRPGEGDEAKELQIYRDRLLSNATRRPNGGKPIKDVADATARLCRNNPRLDPGEAARIAPHLVTSIDGTLAWAFDSRANSVFIGNSSNDNARFWRQVQAPACLVSGRLSYEYWSQTMRNENLNGSFAEGEVEARVQNFPNYEHHWLEHSGHMVHYDEPDRLGVLTRQFLEQHHV